MSDNQGLSIRNEDRQPKERQPEEGKIITRTKDDGPSGTQPNPRTSSKAKDAPNGSKEDPFKEPKNLKGTKVSKNNNKTTAEELEKPPSRRNTMQRVDSDISAKMTGNETDALFTVLRSRHHQG